MDLYARIKRRAKTLLHKTENVLINECLFEKMRR